MSYLDLTILEMHKALLDGKVTALELAKEAIKRAKEDSNNAFECITEKETLQMVNELDNKDKNNPLWGIPFVIKDNFSTKDIETTASSKILEGYVPVFNSEVYQRLVNAGAILIGKTTLDELAMGGTGSTGHKGKTFNPYDPSHKRLIGGSSCGSAAATAASIVPLGIGSDTGDSVRKPAAYSGLIGFKPSWGRISRFGLFAFAASLDHVAYFTRSVEDAALVLECLAGRDLKDATSSEKPVQKYLKNISDDIKGQNIAVINEIYNAFPEGKIKDAFDKSLKDLEEKGANINFVSMDKKLCQAILPTYYIISSAEATSNNANLDGVNFVKRVDGKDYQEIMTNTRTQGFSERIKRRFILGAYSLLSENQKDIFLRAQKARRLIVNAINQILKDNDAIYLPAAPRVAPLFDGDDVKDKDLLIADNYLAIANFAGLPSISVPLGKDNELPFGGNITGRAFEEEKVLNISLALEEITGLKGMSVKVEK